MVEDALVEPLEPSREERQRRLARKLLDERLVELAALRRERDDAMAWKLAVHRLQRRGHDVDAQDHPGAAPVRIVVNLSRRERRGIPVVEESEVELAADDRRDWTALADPGERARNQREDVEAHDAEP